MSADQTAFVVPVSQTYDPSLGLLKSEFSHPVLFSKNRRKDNAFNPHTNCVVYLTVSVISQYSMGVRSLLLNSYAASVV